MKERMKGEWRMGERGRKEGRKEGRKKEEGRRKEGRWRMDDWMDGG
jgi:hypothetical protein